MSVLRMIIADDQHYISSEPHGSCAEKIYALCAQAPINLEELDKLVQSTFAENLKSLLNGPESMDLEPFDAGLIVVDLAKKWVFADDTYFGAARSGTYFKLGDEESKIEYEFSEDWKFVSEAKWFRYLQDCDLKSYFRKDSFNSGLDEVIFENEPGEKTEVDYEMVDSEEDDWDEGISSVHVKFANRICDLVDFKAEDEVEQRDLYTLDHIINYEREAETTEYQIKKANETIERLNIQLQAVQNLSERYDEPRWERKQKHFQVRIDEQRKRITQLSDDHVEAEAMLEELRNFVVTEKFRNVLKKWES